MDNSTSLHWLSRDQSPPTYNQRALHVQRALSRTSWTRYGGAFMLSVTVTTSSLVWTNPWTESRKSGSSTTFAIHQMKRRRLSLADAWVRAGQVHAEAQRRREEQRDREARAFLLSFMDAIE